MLKQPFVPTRCRTPVFYKPKDAKGKLRAIAVSGPLGADAWLGSNVTVLPGVTISEGGAVAAGAVVTCDVAPRTVVGGVPAKLIRNL